MNNVVQKMDEHPVATAAVGAVLIYGAVKLASPKKDEGDQ